MPKTIQFHNTPSFTREFINNWLEHIKKGEKSPVHIAVFEDVLTLIDVAMSILEPGPAEQNSK